MRFIETKKLNDYIASVGDPLAKDLSDDFSGQIGAIETVSIQDFSIDHDKSFLREVSSVLNVIVSILYHPHISNKREEVIIRIEQARQVDREAFASTIKDTKLWKQHDLKMIPEEIYYHQNIDELRIYENRFIGFLVNMIDRELAKFSAFYLSRLPTLTALGTELDSRQIGDVIMEIDRLRRKTQFIKNTHFYKEVTKGKPIEGKIKPTNILLKDRLYRFCFKFYRSFARYEDMASAKRDLRLYYTVLLLKELDRRGFAPVAVRGEEQFAFANADFRLALAQGEGEMLELAVECFGMKTPAARHILGFHVETERPIQEAKQTFGKDFESAELLSLWELYYADAGMLSGDRADTEEELIRLWLASKISKTPTDRSIYKKYCPICKSRGIDEADGIYTCPACSSRYVFDESGDEATVWFRKIRKWGIS